MHRVVIRLLLLHPNCILEGKNLKTRTEKYEYILGHNLFDQKVAKLVETQKFCYYRLNHLFLHRVTYSLFFIGWILRKFAFFDLS